MTYVRPALDLGVYLDERGEPIPYGHRWWKTSPPVETYSVTAHPERFAPLVTVARALREHLIETYDVTVEGDVLRPSDPEAAPLTIEIDDFPVARLYAGVARSERAPMCGCDACDEDVEELADNLERFVFAVVGGRYQEFIKGRRVITEWSDERGASSDETPQKVADKAVVKALKARGKGAIWQPWPQRRA